MRLSKGRDFYDDEYSEDDEIYDDKEDEPRKLRFPERMVGRRNELARMEHLYDEFCRDEDRRTGDLPFLLVSGCSGTGKSTLVSCFRDQLLAKGDLNIPLFLAGKYDQNLPDQEAPAFSAILEAFTRLTDYLEQRDTEERQRLLLSIRAALGRDINAIQPLLPGLAKNLGYPTSKEETTCGKGYTWVRLLYIFQSLVKALCSGERPLILFMDDLQWADQNSLDLISILLRDPTMKNFMVISCVRSSYIDDGGLKEWLSLLEENRIERIELSSFSIEETGRFISETLELKSEETSSLTMAVYNKTRGNIFSTIHALEELHRKNIIHFSVIAFQWEWNVTAVELLQSQLSDDVLMAVIDKIKSFPLKLQKILAIAACTRSVFDKDTLELVIDGVESCLVETPDELSKLLKMAILEGVINQPYGSSHYRFTHDKIQQALQSLISSRSPQLIPVIGKRLYELASETEGEDWMYFAAASHINSTFSSEDPIFLARLFLESGRRAFRLAAFAPAAKFLRKGLEAIGRVKAPWTSQYLLILDLHKILADSEFNLGNFDAGRTLCDAIFLHASNLLDKLPAYHSYVSALGKNMDVEKSKEIILHVLVLLGERPARLKGLEPFRKIQEVKQYFRKHADTDILQLPSMAHKRQIWTMVFTSDLATRAFQSHECALSLQLALQIIQLTAKHGLCGESAFGYALYAHHIFKSKGNFQHAMRIAGLAKEVSNRYSASRGINFFVISYLDCWSLPAASCLTAVQHNQRIALSSGEIESAYLLSAYGNILAFDSGYPLSAIEKKGAEIMEQARLSKMTSYLARMALIQLPVVYLIGSNENPLRWNDLEKCDNCNFDSYEKCQTYLLMHFCIGRLQLGNYFGNLLFAEKMANQLSKLQFIDDSYVNSTNSLFFPGLTFSRLAKQTGKAKYILRARSYRQKLEDKVKAGASNAIHKYLLMDADLTACFPNKKTAPIRKAYDDAIASAMKSGFINIAALGSELAGECFMSKGGSDDISLEYFSQALDFYKEWGATGKVDDLNKRHSMFLCSSSGTNKIMESSDFKEAERAKDLDVLSVLKPRNELPY
jgi:predicted ATPase